MDERPWDRFLTDRDRAVLAAGGFGARAGFGRRPALMVIDVNYAFCGERPEPVLEAVKRWRTSCGEAAWAALPTIRRLIDTAHARGVPVIYTTSAHREDGWDEGSWRWKRSPESAQPPAPGRRSGDDIVDEIAPGPRDIVVLKQKPSGFFGTGLMSWLTLLAVDSLLVTGTTTSGCVRATVVDAFSHNLRVMVVEEGCFDRAESSHAISLLDMHSRYADVIAASEAVDHLQSLSEGMYNLPPGYHVNVEK